MSLVGPSPRTTLRFPREALADQAPTMATKAGRLMATKAGRLMANAWLAREEAYYSHLDHYSALFTDTPTLQPDCSFCAEIREAQRWRARLRRWIDARLPRFHFGPCP